MICSLKGGNANQDVKFVAYFCPTNSRVVNSAALIDMDSSPRLFSHTGYVQVTGWCFDGYGLQPVRIQYHVADHHQISEKTRCTDTIDLLLSRTIPHKICAAARTNFPLFTESNATLNPTTVISDPYHNPHKQYCQLKMDAKCRTLYMK
jgi:hypothetical protein